MKRFLILGCALAGCGGSSAKTVDAGAQDCTCSDTPGAALTLTSTAFAEGGAIPVANSCKGVNTSPALAWTGAPSGTKSFALVLTDLSITRTHWVIYDIAMTATDLPAGIENMYAPGSVTGAHQTVSIHAPTVGYYGPCPPAMHSYQFAVYALDVATLPGLTASSPAQDAVAIIQTHRLGSGTLTGTFTP